MPQNPNQPYYSSMSRGFHIRFDLSDLSKQDRVLLIQNLLWDTGVTLALSQMEQKEIFEVIDKTLEAFRLDGGP